MFRKIFSLFRHKKDEISSSESKSSLGGLKSNKDPSAVYYDEKYKCFSCNSMTSPKESAYCKQCDSFICSQCDTCIENCVQMEVFSKSRSSLSEAKSESISSSETLGIDKHLIDSPWLSVSSNDVAVLSLYKLIESYFNKRLKALSCNFNQSEISIYLSSPVQYLFKFSIEAVYDDLIPSEFEESTNYGYVAIHLFSVNRRITDPIKNKICNLRDFWAYLLCMDSLIKRDFIDAFKNNNSLSDSSLNAYDGVQFHAELEALYSCKEIQKARQELCFIPDDKIKYSGLASEVDEDTDFEHSSINHLFLEKVNAGTSKLGKRRTGNCNRCGGSGYIARYRHIENGRCFLCNRK